MSSEASIPPSLIERIRKIAQEEVAKFARSGSLRNASISGGAGLTIQDGGSLRLLTGDGVEAFTVGPVAPDLPDGSPQPGWIVRRNDGTWALALWDPRPDLDGYTQFLGLYDRSGRVVFSDDTVSGQGIARPHLAHAFYPSRYGDFLKTTSGTFETMWRARVEKQQPKLYVEAWGTTDASGTTGEVRVTVNGAQLGAAQAVSSGSVVRSSYGPDVVGGTFGDFLDVEIQARRTAGTGNVQVGACWAQGTQS